MVGYLVSTGNYSHTARLISNLAQLSVRPLSLSLSLALVDYDKLFNYTNPTTLREPTPAGKLFPACSEQFGRTFSCPNTIEGWQKNKNTLSQSRPALVYKLFIINLINFSVEISTAIRQQQQMSGHRTYVCIQGAEFVQIHFVPLPRTPKPIIQKETIELNLEIPTYQ